MNKRKVTHRQRVLCVFMPILTVLALVATAYLVTLKPEQKWIVAGICSAIYLSVLLLSYIIAAGLDGKGEGKKSGAMITGVMYEKINSMNEPAVLCDASYKIIWANKFVHANTQGGVIGTSVHLLFDYKIKDGQIGMRPRQIVVPFRGRSYIVEEEAIKDYEKSYYLLTLRDTTDRKSVV